MSKYDSASDMIKAIYSPVIKAHFEREVRMNAIFTVSSVEQCISRLKKLRSKRHWFMSKETKDAIHQAQTIIEAYNYLYPRNNFDGSVKIRMMENPD